MAIDDMLRYEKLQYNTNREVAKILALSSGRIDEYEHLTDEKALCFNQIQMIKQAKFAYFPLGKTFRKQKRLKIKVKNIKFF